MHSTPQQSHSTIRGSAAARKRSLFVAAGIALLVVVATVLFLQSGESTDAFKGVFQGSNHDRDSSTPPPPSVGDEQNTLHTFAALDTKQQAKVVKTFDKKSQQWADITAQIAKKKEELATMKPNPYEVGDFGRQYVVAVIERYKNYAERQNPFFEEHGREIAKLQEMQNALKLPSALLSALSSSDPVESTTVGAITQSLLETGDYATIIKKQLAELGELYLPDTSVEQSNQTFGLKNLLVELKRLAPMCDSLFEQKLTAFPSPDAEFRNYLGDQHYANVIDNLMRSYQMGWTQEIESLDLRRTEIGGEMVRLMQSLPMESEERSDLATRLIDPPTD